MDVLGRNPIQKLLYENKITIFNANFSKFVR